MHFQYNRHEHYWCNEIQNTFGAMIAHFLSIAPCKFIAFNLFCFILSLSSLLLFFIAVYSHHSSNNGDNISCRSFSLLQAIIISFPLLFAISSQSDDYRESNN